MPTSRRHAGEVWLFGSAARGDMWPRESPFRSDIDLLVVTSRPLDPVEEQDLLDATYPLFLECGRQIGPQFRTRERLSEEAPLAETVRAEGILLYGHVSGPGP